MAERVQAHPLFAPLTSQRVPSDPAAIRRRLLARSLRLTDSMAPVAYRAARQAQRVLGIEGELEIYQRSGGENASIHLVEDPVLLEIQGRLLPLLDEGALFGVFGHELGHYLAHGPWGALGRVHSLTGAIGHPDLDPELDRYLRGLSMLAELTADRVGLLACQDLHAMLRLEMIALTGLSGEALTWDTVAYLAQSRELMESVLDEHGAVYGSTHPEHSLRAYALWLFSESDAYRSLTGQGSGARPLTDVDALLMRFFGEEEEAARVEPGYHLQDEPPRELHECALAAAVIVAFADGDFAEEEAEAIERIFAPLVGNWADYLNFDVAVTRFVEVAPVVAIAGGDLQRALFNLLVHVMGADGVIEEAEVGAILTIGEVLGCADEYRRLLASTLSALDVSIEVEDAEPAPLPLPARRQDAAAAFDAFLAGIRRRGEATITLRRLLRLLGSERRDDAVVAKAARALQAHGIECDEDLEVVELDQRLHLVAPEAVREEAERPSLPIDASREGLRKALTRMRDLLVSGDGRSPSVRLRTIRRGRSFDLVDLDDISVGRAEQVLATVRGGRSTSLVRASEAGSHKGAEQVAKRLTAVARENRSRIEETGANDLYLGYPFLTGLVGDGKRSATYLVRAPLVLYPVDLVETAKGARGFQAALRKNETPIVNQSLLRLVFNKKGFAFPDDLSDEFDNLAGDPTQGLEGVLAKLAEVGLKPVHRPGPLRRFRDRDEELAERGAFLELEEAAVLGIFPQSSSDLLQDYDGLIAQLADPRADLGALLASAQVLLPDSLRPAHAVPDQAESQTRPRPPVVLADPSQRKVVAKARQNGAMVVDGPPGTGKSQVIVNLVADALARGERVAVVCEKRAALDVVCQRLDGLGLRHLLGLVHDVHEDRRPLYDQIAQRIEGYAPVDFDEDEARQIAEDHQGLVENLASRDAALAAEASAGGVTVGELASLASDPASPLLTAEAGLVAVPTSRLRGVRDAVVALQPFRDLWARGSRWRAPNGAPARPSLATWSKEAMGTLVAQTRAAAEKARRYEHLLSQTPAPLDAVEAARGSLHAFRETRALRADPQQNQLFGHVLNVAVDAPHQLPAMGEAKAAWSESGAALLKWEQPVTMTVTPEFESAVAVLRRWTGSFLRFFIFGWWMASWKVRGALKRLWPERSADPLDAEFLEAIVSRIHASRGWDRIRNAVHRVGLAPMLPASATGAGRFLERLEWVAGHATPLAQARPSLAAAQAWLPGDPSWDRTVDERMALLTARDELREAVRPLAAALPWVKPLPPSVVLDDWAKVIASQGQRVATMDHHFAAGTAAMPGLQGLLDRLNDDMGDKEADRWSSAVRRTWASAWLKRTEKERPQLATFGTPADVEWTRRAATGLADIEKEVSELEVERVITHADRAQLLRVPAAQKHKRRSEEQKLKELLLKEVRKKRRLMPLRSFVRRFAEHGLLDVVPVWLLSPETMAILFPREPLFDLVIFDEASQCTVEAGFPVLLRAKRVVVAGDEKQMPPSSYFSLGSTEDDETPPEDEDERQLRDVLTAESLLTLARTRVAHSGLSWHYRCQDEALIAFSNHSMYHGELLTIPATAGPSADSAIRWVAVEGGEYDKGENRPEAERVVDLLHELLERESPPSVGVVTFNLRQRRAVLDAVDARRARENAFAELWDAAQQVESLDERPFVKNLEQVQGDERDVIVFSLGHAPRERIRRGEPTGEFYVPARFGPLGQRGGERRLNVAISRAKKECFIVSSFDPKDLSVGNTKNEGPKLFAQFLEFAHHMSQGRRAQADHVLDLVREAKRSPHHRRQKHAVDGYTPLVTQLALALEAERTPFELDVGASEFSVPLALPDPQDPTRFRLAILADEGTESMTPFERYVHRPAVLRLRGWDVMHVTSLDWRRRGKEVLSEIFQRVPGLQGALDGDVWKRHREAQRAAAPPPPPSKGPSARAPRKAQPPIGAGVAEKRESYLPAGPSWAAAIEDPKFRAALVFLDKHGTLNERDLVNLVGGARRARRFAAQIDTLVADLPFAVELTTVSGAKVYQRVPAAPLSEAGTTS
jgi:RecA/RadA recombinase